MHSMHNHAASRLNIPLPAVGMENTKSCWWRQQIATGYTCIKAASPCFPQLLEENLVLWKTCQFSSKTLILLQWILGRREALRELYALHGAASRSPPLPLANDSVFQEPNTPIKRRPNVSASLNWKSLQSCIFSCKSAKHLLYSGGCSR